MKCSDIFYKNIAAYKENSFYDVVFDSDYTDQLIAQWENNNYQARLDTASDGSLIAVSKDGSRYYNSRYAPQYAAEIWASQFQQEDIAHIFFVLGFANGMYGKALMDVIHPLNNVFFYEPDLELYLNILNEIDISEILRSSNNYIMVKGIEDAHLVDFLSIGISYHNYKKVTECMLPNYMQYKDSLEEIDKILEYNVEFQQLARNTTVVVAEACRKNELANLPDVISQHSANQLVKRFQKLDIKNVPAILVSAGPSLDKNIQDLKKAEGHALIVVVDTALKTVIRNNIIPDLIVCIDPRKPLVFFENEKFKNIPIVIEKDIPMEIVKQHKGSRFYIGKSFDLSEYLADKYEKGEYLPLPSGGSVANSAYSLIRQLGFSRIILMGQDLAFTDGKWHTKDAYDDEVKNKKDALESLGRCEVEGIYGGMVQTESRMRSYLLWFENMILKHPNLKVVDATEGGAMIHGSEIITLKQAIEKYGSQDEIDFKKIIGDIQPLFDEKELAEIKEYLRNINMYLDEYALKVKDEIQVYRDLQKEIQRKNKDQLMKLMKKIKEINLFKYVDPFSTMLYKYIVEYEYEAHDKINELESNDEGSEESIQNAIDLLEKYILASEQMKQETYLLTDQL